jgi:Kazal-type serine protease inhibitor-like protein
MRTRKALVAAIAALTLMIPAGSADAAGPGKTCGSLSGQWCDVRLFCQFRPGTCGRFDLTGTCARMPRFCPQVTGPPLVVCGCNGQTYGNDCMRQQAGVSLAHKGKC